MMTDYEALSQLVLWERQARVRRLQAELADCYWEDATVTTSWSSGSAASYLNSGNSGNHRAEAAADEVIINRSVAPLIHYHGGNRAYAELHVNPEDLKGLRRSYMWLSYVRIRAGGSVSHDLLGIDRPDDVQNIYEENEAWISEKDGI